MNQKIIIILTDFFENNTEFHVLFYQPNFLSLFRLKKHFSYERHNFLSSKGAYDKIKKFVGLFLRLFIEPYYYASFTYYRLRFIRKTGSDS